MSAAGQEPWRAVNPELAPLVEAELRRSNVVVSSWHRAASSADNQYTELTLLFPPDAAAITAEFVLPDGVWAEDGRIGSVPSESMIVGRRRPDRRRRQAQEQWWNEWQRQPRPPRPVSAGQPPDAVPDETEQGP